MSRTITVIGLIGFLVLINCCSEPGGGKSEKATISQGTVDDVIRRVKGMDTGRKSEMVKKGVSQLAANWRVEDGSEDDFISFCTENIIDEKELAPNLERISDNLVAMWGHSSIIRFSWTESERFTDTREVKADPFFRESMPSADLYKGKLAHFIQLNFPYYTPAEKRINGESWSREEWTMAALGDTYAHRTDRNFKKEATEESNAFRKYMQHYFLRMDHISAEDGSYPFPQGSLLHSHRGLRDNCKEEYTRQGGYERQRITGKVIEHILLGTVPQEFLEDTTTWWDPWSNELFRKDAGTTVKIEYESEGTIRYAGFRSVFLNRSSEDKMFDDGSSVISRTFDNHNLEISEVETLIREFLSDPVISDAGKLIEKEVGRPLEPFDIWYSGFQEQSLYPADFLDSITMSRYPDPLSLQLDVPSILVNMGFSEAEAKHIGAHTSVRPVVSGGYTDSPPLRGENALMTTMFGPGGLDYKSYRVAMHELGHVVCAVYSTDEADNFLLAGVPTSGITEAMAELLAYKNAEGLGLNGSNPELREHMLSLATLWYLVEMGGQALTDIESWKWIYANPGATEEEVRDAIISITENIWNTYFAEIFGVRDQHILSIYNHFITGSLYLFNYFLGDVIMYQLHDAYRSGDLAVKLKEACKEGNTTPGLWMSKAVGTGISTEPLMDASAKAIKYFSAK